jgi:hypothetical protein
VTEKAPPQLSPDGRWWWNGDQWVPVEHSSADAYCHNCRQWVRPTVEEPSALAAVGCLGLFAFVALVSGLASLTGLFLGQLGNIKWGSIGAGLVALGLGIGLYRHAKREPAKVSCPICKGDHLSRPVHESRPC